MLIGSWRPVFALYFDNKPSSTTSLFLTTSSKRDLPMKLLITSTALIVGLIASAGVYAAPPAGATGLCKDGTYHMGATKKGACRGHKGIQEWYADAASPTTASTAVTAAAPKASKKSAAGAAPTSSAAPAGATGLCNDGSYHTGANKQGACRGHKGIKEWYGASATGSSAPAPASEAAPAKKGMFSFVNKKPATTAAEPATAPTAATTRAAAPVAAGGGAGKVWVNTDSQVYHCQTSHWYGKTKTGQYMTEAAAKAAGARPDHGKACI
jgi:hypothetical protein